MLNHTPNATLREYVPLQQGLRPGIAAINAGGMTIHSESMFHYNKD